MQLKNLQLRAQNGSKKKKDLTLIEVFMNGQSHYFLIYTFMRKVELR